MKQIQRANVGPPLSMMERRRTPARCHPHSTDLFMVALEERAGAHAPNDKATPISTRYPANVHISSQDVYRRSSAPCTQPAHPVILPARSSSASTSVHGIVSAPHAVGREDPATSPDK